MPVEASEGATIEAIAAAHFGRYFQVIGQTPATVARQDAAECEAGLREALRD